MSDEALRDSDDDSFVSGIISVRAAPIERVALSAECRGIIARLLEATDESFDHYSPSDEKASATKSCSRRA
jgi:hypothetical protein